MSSVGKVELKFIQHKNVRLHTTGIKDASEDGNNKLDH